MTRTETTGDRDEVGRRITPEPPKGEETVAEIGKEYIHGSTVRWCR